MNDSQLIQRIVEAALLRGTFTLRSGRISSYYLDKYLFETEPDILAEVAKRLAKFVDKKTDRVAGAELGGIPLVTALSLNVHKPCVLVRNSKKGYGPGKLYEGRLGAGENVLLVEDVVTTGGQVIEAAKVLQEAGANVTAIVTVVDRQEGGRANIQDAGFKFEALFTKSDLGIDE